MTAAEAESRAEAMSKNLAESLFEIAAMQARAERAEADLKATHRAWCDAVADMADWKAQCEAEAKDLDAIRRKLADLRAAVREADSEFGRRFHEDPQSEAWMHAHDILYKKTGLHMGSESK